jgi:riboflavin kinase/FMN adenylyltransferase
MTRKKTPAPVCRRNFPGAVAIPQPRPARLPQGRAAGAAAVQPDRSRRLQPTIARCPWRQGYRFAAPTAIFARPALIRESRSAIPVLRIVRHPGPGSSHPKGAVLAMGNFDGLHRGHAALIGEACERARAAGAAAGVLTFEPHPRSVLMPNGEPFRLTPFRVKEREIARLGADLLFVQHFDLDFAKKSAESFVAEVLVGAIGVRHVVVGHDCTFGNRRRGTPDMLRAAGAEHGFGVTVVEPVRGPDAAVYSSTHIRELLRAGRPREAAAQLGRFWEIDGRVMEGDRRGRTIGFPTVNLSLGEYLRPAFGVYAVRVSGDGTDDPFDGQTIDGVANIGMRPTVGTPEPRLEANLFDVDADLYGRHLRVSLIEFIRPERRFAGLDALKAQIAEDAAQASAILAAAPLEVPGSDGS